MPILYHKAIIKIKFILLHGLMQISALWYRWRARAKHPVKHLGFIAEEFYHQDLRGFGGFGKTVLNIANYYAQAGHQFRVKVFLSEALPRVSQEAALKEYHDTDVLLRPPTSVLNLSRAWQYVCLSQHLDIRIFMTIDYYESYKYTLLLNPSTPVLIWLRDPRDKEEWDKIGTVELVRQMRENDDFEALAEQKARSLRQLSLINQRFGRKVIFASNGDFLTERAKRTFQMPELNPYRLPNAIPLDGDRSARLSQRPSLLYLGRIDPIKRPWVVCELARRYPKVDFYFAGQTHCAQLMEPVLEPYSHLRNIFFLGHVEEEQKHHILRQSWGLINTSIHEGYPVSFQEAFAYGKPVISCQDPDGLVQRYGYFTGEILGDGRDSPSLNKFSRQMDQFLEDDKLRSQKGRAARRYVEETHSYKKFHQCLTSILEQEGIL